MRRRHLFLLGLLPLGFIIWGWHDSLRAYSYVSGESAKYAVAINHVRSVFFIEYRSRSAPELFPREFSFWREIGLNGKSPFRLSESRFFPAPNFEHELPDLPYEQLSEEDRDRAEKGESAGGITIPYWLVLLIYLLFWLSFTWFGRSPRLPNSGRCSRSSDSGL